MKRTALLFFLIFFLNAGAQDSDRRFLDSMQTVIRNAKTDYKRARVMLQLSDYWSYRDTAKAFEQIRMAQKYVKDDESLKGLSLIYEAGIVYDLDIAKSQKLYLKAEEILKNIHTDQVYEDRSTLWHNYAALEKLKGNDRNFIDIIIKKCIPLAELVGNKNIIAGYQTDIGLGLIDIKDYKGSENYLLSAIRTLESIGEGGVPLLWTHINLANLYLTTKASAKAKKHLDIAGNLLKTYPENQYGSLYFLYLTRYLNSQNQMDAALNASDKGIALAKRLNITFDLQSLNVLKNESTSIIENAIKEVLADSVFMSGEVQKSLVNNITQAEHKRPVITRREKEVLNLLSAGYSTPEIAEKMFISTETVASHRKNLLQKFDVGKTVLMIQKAREMKII